MSLISREKLLAHYAWWGDTEERRLFDEIIDQQPTVDAEPVVRCKDCKWWKTGYFWNGTERKVCAIEPYEPCRNPNDYCSRGERKDGADDGEIY